MVFRIPESAFRMPGFGVHDGSESVFRMRRNTQMGRLNQVGIPVYVLHGNHDAASQITRRLTLPDNVHVFSHRRPESFHIEDLGTALHGQSFPRRDVTDNLAQGYPDPVDGVFNIGVLHTGLGGMGGHENYAPCSLKELVNKGYLYWALGHVHQAEVLGERPHIVFPGNLQGRHVREVGEKGAYLVTVVDNQVEELAMFPCDVVRWVNRAIQIDNSQNLRDLLDLIREDLQHAVASVAEGRLLACRIHLLGRTGLHEQLLASGEKILVEARSIALGLGDNVAWIEKVVVSTEPELDPEMAAEREDAIGDLQRMLKDAHDDPDLLRQLEFDIGELCQKMPHDVRSEVEDPVLRSMIDGNTAGAIDAVTPFLISRLTADED